MFKNNSIWVSEDMYNALLPILHLNIVTGLFPISIQKRNDMYCFKFSLRRVIAGYILMCVWFSIAVYGLYRTYQIDVYYQIRLGRTSATVATLSEVGILLLTCIVGTLTIPLKIKHLWIYLESVKKVDSLLGKNKPSKPKKYNMIVIIAFLGVLYIIIMDLSLYNKTIGKHATVLVLARDFSPFYYTYIFTMLLQSNLYVFVKIITARIRKMNEMILSLLKSNGEELGDTINITKVEEKHPLREMYWNNSHNINPNKRVMARSVSIGLRQIYANLLQASKAFNNMMNFIMMFVLLGILMHLLVTPYCLYQQLQYTKSAIFLFGQTSWMLGHILRFLMFVQPCQACTEEIHKSADLICQLMSITTDEQAFNQLNILLIHMTHCPIEFTAWGFTKINRKLIPPILGAVTTYLVILFQYPN